MEEEIYHGNQKMEEEKEEAEEGYIEAKPKQAPSSHANAMKKSEKCFTAQSR